MSDKRIYPDPPDGIKVLPNGAGYDMNKGHIVHGPGTYGPNPHAITKENAHEYHRMNKEKTVRDIQASIKAQTSTNERVNVKVLDASHAVGIAAGLLWQDIVLNADAPARARKDTWSEISKRAELVSDPRAGRVELPASGVTVHVGADSIARLKELLDNRSTDS